MTARVVIDSRADQLAYTNIDLFEPGPSLVCTVIRALGPRIHVRLPRTRYPGSAPPGVVRGSRVAPTGGASDQKAAMRQSVLLEDVWNNLVATLYSPLTGSR